MRRAHDGLPFSIIAVRSIDSAGDCPDHPAWLPHREGRLQAAEVSAEDVSHDQRDRRLIPAAECCPVEAISVEE